MAKSPDQIVAENERKQNEEDLGLPKRMAKAVVNLVKPKTTKPDTGDMQKAGFYDKGKTKSERQKIVSKVTTKPQRVAIVEKAFSTKNMKAGGMASKRADGCCTKGKTRGRMV
jgi:mannose/fructose/N-acetylgalactosamine-specific phosphotransferase system component IIB